MHSGVTKSDKKHHKSTYWYQKPTSYHDPRLPLPSTAMGEYVLMVFTNKMPFFPFIFTNAILASFLQTLHIEHLKQRN